MRELRFFVPIQEVSILMKRLPHWSQPGTIAFITWRAADSLPPQLQDELTRQHGNLLTQMGLDPRADWKAAVEQLPAAERGRVKWSVVETWDQMLGSGVGASVLIRPEFAAIVEKSLLHFDEARYYPTDAIVMPNLNGQNRRRCSRNSLPKSVLAGTIEGVRLRPLSIVRTGWGKEVLRGCHWLLTAGERAC